MEKMKKIKVNLHGHFLPDFSEYWRKEFGIKDGNLAKAAFDRCLATGIGIYAITNEPHILSFSIKSRFEQVFEEARNLPNDYKLDSLGINAFVISHNNDEVYFLDSQSTRVIIPDENNRKAEILSFGSGKIPIGMPLYDALSYLDDHGLPKIPEHALCKAHFGIGKKKLEELCREKKITAVEHNAQLVLSNKLSSIPPFSNYVKKRNTEAIEIANRYRIPVISSDDSNGLNHIGTAYNIFTAEKIRLDTGDHMTEDLTRLIEAKEFTPEFGYLPFKDWVSWAVIGMAKEKLSRKIWERINL